MKPSILFYESKDGSYKYLNEPLPKVTVCCLIAEVVTYVDISFGFTMCSKKDQFVTATGRKIAEERAMKENFVISIKKEAYSPRSVMRIAQYLAIEISVQSKFGKDLLYKEKPSASPKELIILHNLEVEATTSAPEEELKKREKIKRDVRKSYKKTIDRAEKLQKFINILPDAEGVKDTIVASEPVTKPEPEIETPSLSWDNNAIASEEAKVAGIKEELSTIFKGIKYPDKELWGKHTHFPTTDDELYIRLPVDGSVILTESTKCYHFEIEGLFEFTDQIGVVDMPKHFSIYDPDVFGKEWVFVNLYKLQDRIFKDHDKDGKRIPWKQLGKSGKNKTSLESYSFKELKNLKRTILLRKGILTYVESENAMSW